MEAKFQNFFCQHFQNRFKKCGHSGGAEQPSFKKWKISAQNCYCHHADMHLKSNISWKNCGYAVAELENLAKKLSKTPCKFFMMVSTTCLKIFLVFSLIFAHFKIMSKTRLKTENFDMKFACGYWTTAAISTIVNPLAFASLLGEF